MMSISRLMFVKMPVETENDICIIFRHICVTYFYVLCLRSSGVFVSCLFGVVCLYIPPYLNFLMTYVLVRNRT